MSIESSVNKAELEKFRKISSQWWKDGGEFKMLHQINPIRFEYILEKMTNHFNISNDKLSILDVGCGGGLITSRLCEFSNQVTGIDAIQENIDVAVQYASEHNLDIIYHKSTIEEFVASSIKQYDVVLCLEVIEHVDNLSGFIKNLTSLVKPNGIVIISTINRTVKAYLLAIIMAEYVLNWVPKKTHDYSKFLKPSEISLMFKENNMELKELKGLTYNIANNSWELSNDIDVNYFAYLTKMQID